MPNPQIWRTKGVTISISNEVVMVLLDVLGDAKSHNEVVLHKPLTRKGDTCRSCHGKNSLLLALFT
jgi:hypothetical protein